MSAFKPTPYTPPNFAAAPLAGAPEIILAPAPADCVAPAQFHSTGIAPEYFHWQGKWHLAAESRMDCAVVWESGLFAVKECRRLKKGDAVVTGRTEDGSEGIFVHHDGFKTSEADNCDNFAFRQGRSRETAFSMDYDGLYDLLRHEKEHGYTVWVMGPACTFDHDSRHAFASLVQNGYVDALLGGNALATHDLEGCYLKTALGQDIYTQECMPNGHYNHLDTINAVRAAGSIEDFVKQNGYTEGIMSSCVNHNIPYVLAGSIRDDGPLPGVYADVYASQDAMRAQLSRATTLICMATTLHSIAAGNITPSFRVMPNGVIRPIYFYSVDISEFSVNKLADRGSLSAKGIVTNVQDFVVNISKGLGVYPSELLPQQHAEGKRANIPFPQAHGSRHAK